MLLNILLNRPIIRLDGLSLWLRLPRQHISIDAAWHSPYADNRGSVEQSDNSLSIHFHGIGTSHIYSLTFVRHATSMLCVHICYQFRVNDNRGSLDLDTGPMLQQHTCANEAHGLKSRFANEVDVTSKPVHVDKCITNKQGSGFFVSSQTHIQKNRLRVTQ